MFVVLTITGGPLCSALLSCPQMSSWFIYFWSSAMHKHGFPIFKQPLSMENLPKTKQDNSKVLVLERGFFVLFFSHSDPKTWIEGTESHCLLQGVHGCLSLHVSAMINRQLGHDPPWWMAGRRMFTLAERSEEILWRLGAGEVSSESSSCRDLTSDYIFQTQTCP